MMTRRRQTDHTTTAEFLERRNSLSSPSRRGFTVLELLTVIGIVSTLAAIVLPAVGSAREAARRIQCVNQLKQVGIALHGYHEVCRSFPPGWQWESTNQSAYGWAVPLLPYLEQNSIYEHTNRDVQITAPSNAKSRTTSIELLLCPSDLTEPTFMLTWEDETTGEYRPLFELPTASYFGVFGTSEPDDIDDPNPPVGEGTFIETQSIRLANLQRGPSNTIIVGERTMARVPATWLGISRDGADATCRLTGNVRVSPNCDLCDECEFSSRHPGGSNFLWGDGRVSLVAQTIDSREYQRMSRRTDD
jgi:prepilin-type N-terminal cleavage/methylation domain-containing protein/prepilin-type processing-associated H-X9-DG protein